MDVRKLTAEFLGTMLLVIVGVGVATLSFGFNLTDVTRSAGIVATALAFGLILLGLAYTLGPISGCHVNPAVTLGFVVAGRMSWSEAWGYWVAQFAGGLVGALALFGLFSATPGYSRSVNGLGADGFGHSSMIGLNPGGAAAAEIVLTFIFVFVVLGATSRLGSPGFAGLAIGLTLTVVHLIGIPLTGTSVNPARALGPAVIVGAEPLRQLPIFILAPLAGGILAALVYRFLFAAERTVAEADAAAAVVADRSVGPTSATP